MQGQKSYNIALVFQVVVLCCIEYTLHRYGSNKAIRLCTDNQPRRVLATFVHDFCWKLPLWKQLVDSQPVSRDFVLS